MNKVGFVAFLGVLIAVGCGIAYTGTVAATFAATYMAAATLRWSAIATVMIAGCFAALAMRHSKKNGSMSVFAAWLLVLVSAATWFGVVFPGWVILAQEMISGPMMANIIETEFSFVFILAGLVGALMSSGLRRDKCS